MSGIRNIDAAIAGLVMQAMEIEYKFQEMDKALLLSSSSSSSNDSNFIIAPSSNTSSIYRKSDPLDSSSINLTGGVKNLSREICRSIIKTYAIHAGIIKNTNGCE